MPQNGGELSVCVTEEYYLFFLKELAHIFFIIFNSLRFGASMHFIIILLLHALKYSYWSPGYDAWNSGIVI